MDAFSRSFTITFQVLLVIEQIGVMVIYGWALWLLFTRRENNVGRASFMTPAFVCVMCESARTIDPFARWGIWSNRTLRVWLTIEIWIMLSLLLLACDISAWLNYISVPSLLLKPQRRFRHALYVGIFLMLIQSMILIGIDLLSADVSRGVTLGWLFSALIMILIGWYSMLKSIIEVNLALDLRSRTESKVADTIFCIDDEEEYYEDIKPKDRSTRLAKCMRYLTCAFIFETYENASFWKKVKYMKKSWRLAKYMMCLACLLIFDISFGVNPTPGRTDLLHLVYDLILKIMLTFMIFQRRPISDPRGYERDIHKAYKPFNSTLFSGSRELHTHDHLERKVKEANEKMRLKDNKNPIPNLTSEAKSRNYRVVSYDNDSVTNTPLEGDIKEKQEITMVCAPVRPPKDVSSMNDTPTRPARKLTLPSLGETAAAEDVNISKSGASLQVPNERIEAPPVRCGTDEIAVESADSTVEDASLELVHKNGIELEKDKLKSFRGNT